MSFETSEQRLCYVHCNFCNTILAVSVPCSSMSISIVTVRCGHCSNLLSVNIGALLQSTPHYHHHHHQKQLTAINEDKTESEYHDLGSSSFQSILPEVPIAQEKRKRVPSAYNRFIKEEIKRIKTSNPVISHREAFSTAAKNWAHFPHIPFCLRLEETSK